jgi:hypothetical protein
MTPFSEAPTRLKPSLLARFSARRALLVFALCILAGLATVTWLAKGRLEAARRLASTEARACGVSLEVQFNQTSGAVEALGILAKQGRGGLANSTRLQDALRRAQLGDLSRQGYDFALYIAPPTQQKPVVIVSHGLSSLEDTIQQQFRVQNFELRLALKPRGGWIDKTKVVLESLAVLLISAIVALSVNLLEGRRAIETELKEATQRLARETADRVQAQADCTRAKERVATGAAELKHAQLALEQAESKATQYQAQLDENIRTRTESLETLQAELKKTRATLQKTQEANVDIQERLDAATQAEKAATLASEQQIQGMQAEIADLQTRLEMLTRSAREAVETSAATVAQFHQSNRELEGRLIIAEQGQARARKLEELLQKAENELKRWQEAPTRKTQAALAGAVHSIPVETLGELPKVVSIVPALSVKEVASADIQGDSTGASPEGHKTLDPSDLHTPETANLPTSGEPTPEAARGTEVQSADVATLTEPSPVRKETKASRRKQTRRDDQLPLFDNEVLAVPPSNRRTAAVEARAVEVKELEIPTTKTSTPAPAPSSDPQETSTEQKGNKDLTEASEQAISSSVAVEVASVERLTPTEGFADAGDDSKHDLKLLRKFAEEQAKSPDRIRDALLQGDLTVAQKVVHAVKVAAHEIGASAVENAATALARACNEESDPSEIESVWDVLEKEMRDLVVTIRPVVLPKEDKPAPSRRLPPAPPVDPTQLRKAVNQILPLLAERDPGAKDCLKDNRTTFRSTFTPEAYVEFEQLVKSGGFDPALEQLRKAVRKHGIAL